MSCNQELKDCCPCHSGDPAIKATADGDCSPKCKDFTGFPCECSFTEEEAVQVLLGLGFEVERKSE